MKLTQPCLDCGRPTRSTRCTACARISENERSRRRPTRSVDRRAWKVLSTAVRQAWVAEHGLVCPGDAGHDRHEVATMSDLTVDHIVPRASGGSDRLDNLRVICRSANSRKGAR